MKVSQYEATALNQVTRSTGRLHPIMQSPSNEPSNFKFNRIGIWTGFLAPFTPGTFLLPALLESPHVPQVVIAKNEILNDITKKVYDTYASPILQHKVI